MLTSMINLLFCHLLGWDNSSQNPELKLTLEMTKYNTWHNHNAIIQSNAKPIYHKKPNDYSF